MQPIELDGQRVEKLVWNADEKTFSSPDGTTRLELIADPLGLREERFWVNMHCLIPVRKRMFLSANNPMEVF